MPCLEKSFFLHKFLLKVSSNERISLNLISQQLNLLGKRKARRRFLTIKFSLHKVKYNEIPLNKPNIFSVYPLFQASQIENKKYSLIAGLRTIGSCIDINKREIDTYFSQEEYFDKNLLFDLIFFQPLKSLLRYFGYFVLHCSCMAKGNDAILIPGDSGCGKTTIALSLLRKGFKFLSDDDTILRPSGSNIECLSLPMNPKIKSNLIKYFPEIKNKFLREANIHFSRKKIVDIKKLYADNLQDRAIPKLIIFPKYCPQTKIKIKRLSKKEAFNRLWRLDLNDSFDRQKQCSRLDFNLLANLVRKTEAFELHYRDKDIDKIPDIINSFV